MSFPGESPTDKIGDWLAESFPAGSFTVRRTEIKLPNGKIRERYILEQRRSKASLSKVLAEWEERVEEQLSANPVKNFTGSKRDEVTENSIKFAKQDIYRHLASEIAQKRSIDIQHRGQRAPNLSELTTKEFNKLTKRHK